MEIKIIGRIMQDSSPRIASIIEEGALHRFTNTELDRDRDAFTAEEIAIAERIGLPPKQ